MLLRKWVFGVILVGLSTYLFFFRLDYPENLIFDETYHIPSAQKYLSGVFFQENHPPLGKLLIAAGELIFNSDGNHNQLISMNKVDGDVEKIGYFGYRFFSALFGIGSILLFYLLLSTIIKNKVIAGGVSLVASLDNGFLVQSRAAMLDSFLIFFILFSLFCSWYLAEKNNNRWQLLLWSTFLGLSIAGAVLIKHTGLITLLPMIFCLWELRRRGWEVVVCVLALILTTFSVVYVGVWKTHYQIADKVVSENYYETNEEIRAVILDGKGGFWKSTVAQIAEGWKFSENYNLGVPKLDLCKVDEIGSPWYYWPMGGRAINFRWEEAGPETYRYIYLMGNPMTWFMSLLGAIYGTAITISMSIGWVKKEKHLTAIGGLTIIYWAYLLTLSTIHRVMYLYHYFPALFIGLILFALNLESFYERSHYVYKSLVVKIILSVVVLLTIIAFLAYKPLTYYEPIKNEQFEKLKLLPVWDLKSIGEVDP